MIPREYIYDPIGTSVSDLGEGHLLITLAQSGDTSALLEQAEWLLKIIDEIYRRHGRALQILIDLGALYRIPDNDALRDKYVNLLLSEVVKKTAIVGNAFVLASLAKLFSTLDQRREKIKFFFRLNDAKDWLGW